jgi:exopolyphosphatase/pppGpp-phosphohydrolase
MNHERLDLTEVPSGEFSTMHQFLVGSSLAERKKHPAIPAIRAEFMPLASHLVKYVYELGNIKQIYCSTHALKEGVLSELEAQ